MSLIFFYGLVPIIFIVRMNLRFLIITARNKNFFDFLPHFFIMPNNWGDKAVNTLSCKDLVKGYLHCLGSVKCVDMLTFLKLGYSCK